MDIDDVSPIVRRHFVEHTVAQDASRVKDDMQSSKLITRLLHHSKAILIACNRAKIRRGLTATRLNGVGDLFRRTLLTTFAPAANAWVIDQHLGPVRREHLGDLRADATAAACYHRHATIQHTHLFVPPVKC